MKALISTMGSRGDVQPLLALAVELKARGHDSTLCANPNFGSWIRSFGIECATLGSDSQQLLKKSSGVKPDAARVRKTIHGFIEQQFTVLAEAADGCDLIIGGGATQVAAHSIAERYGIPYVYVAYSPCTLPSPRHAPPMIRAQSLPPFANKLLWRRKRREFNRFYGQPVNDGRSRLGLPRIDDVHGYMFTSKPWLAADPTLAPGENLDGMRLIQTGAWILDDAGELPDELESFLRDGEAPIYFGFGSVVAPTATTRTLIEAARRLGKRLVLSQGWRDDWSADRCDADVIATGDVDLAKLFSRVAAIVHHGGSGTTTADEGEIIERVLGLRGPIFGAARKRAFEDSPFFNIGVESQRFKNLARHFSDSLFDRFYRFAKQNVTRKLPLLIGGGCGLNCDWNSRWQSCGLFSDVFVPPCTNDSGAALGAAVDAKHMCTGEAKLDWDVYAGEHFLQDTETGEFGFHGQPLDLAVVCDMLVEGKVLAWVQGRYEMGPRALGNRSLLAAPFSASSRKRLNTIKRRERFRPVAPICLDTEFETQFQSSGESPYMLYFQNVRFPDKLAAIAHVDGSARAQTVTESENQKAHALLTAFKRRTGYGVLCNTSLNFSGRGFINRMSDLVRYARHGRRGAGGDRLNRWLRQGDPDRAAVEMLRPSRSGTAGHESRSLMYRCRPSGEEQPS